MWGRRAAALLLACGTLAGCAPAEDAAEPVSPAARSGDDAAVAAHDRVRPLRPGERRLTLRMTEAYTPSRPNGAGTDDYRCFLLDPGLRRDAFVTGTHVLPGNLDVVHHVILFRVAPDWVPVAEQRDAAESGPGWTCFGGTGLGTGADVDDPGWLGAWAPGGTESVLRPGLGTELPAGSRIVMQVHYNLLAGAAPDVSAAQLRVAGPGADLTPLGTMLLPAPVELPCRRGHDASPLCDRDAALADVKERFGSTAGSTADWLHLLCDGAPHPGNVQRCTRTVREPMTVHGVAGHMHLLGRSIRVDVEHDGERRTLLDIPVWNFDDQGARPVHPVQLQEGDRLTVTCRHVQWLRDRLPAFEGQPDRYVVWGEGTTDEMCLGILQVTRP